MAFCYGHQSLLRPLPSCNYPPHATGYTGSHRWRPVSHDLKPVALEPEGRYLLAAKVHRVPGNIVLDNILVSFEAINAGDGDHGVQKRGALLLGVRCLPPFRRHDLHHSPLRGEDAVARRILSHAL